MPQQYFHDLAKALDSMLQGGEVYTASFEGEDSDFVRFNRSRVRQAGHVAQRTLHVDLIRGRRHAKGGLSLAGNLEVDRPRLSSMVDDLRETLGHLPEDPYLLYSTEVRSGERVGEDRLPEGRAAVADIQAAAGGRDLVGIYAAGGIYSGFASSLGQRNWYSSWSFNLDWSFYHERDKAVKALYAGFDWSPQELGRKVDWAARELDVLRKPARTVPPGRYRVYLSPAALYDIVSLLAWGGFGLKAHRTKQTPLLRMVEGDARLSPAVRLEENTREGIAPDFQEAGFLRPPRVTLIDGGAYRDCLVSPRSAGEFGVPTNGAGSEESPESVDMAPGDLPRERVLGLLDTGIYINNVWYLNYSDRTACRTTGMTRFATFWVEGGEIRAPLNVMRFDETIYRMLGENLVGLTAERDLILDPHTYLSRSTRSGRLPGALVEDFTLTL